MKTPDFRLSSIHPAADEWYEPGWRSIYHAFYHPVRSRTTRPRGAGLRHLQRLMKNERIVFLTGEVDDEQSDRIIAQLLYLTSIDDKADIKLYINSPGGSVTAGMAIYDTMQYVLATCRPCAWGSPPAWGRPCSPPAPRQTEHPAAWRGDDPSGSRRPAARLPISRSERRPAAHQGANERDSARLTGQSLNAIKKDTDRDNFMTARETLEYGLIETIVERTPWSATQEVKIAPTGTVRGVDQKASTSLRRDEI